MLPGVSRTNYRRCSVDVAREVDWQHHRFQVPAAAVVATAETEFVVDIGLVRLVEAALEVALAAAVAAAAAAGFA